MQSRNQITNDNPQNLVRTLLVGWLIILCTYLFIRMIFILLGLTLYSAILGGCLAIIPYLLGTLYLRKRHAQQKTWFYVLDILFPSIIEKAAMYFLGAFLYGLNPGNVTGVMQAISSHKLYVNFLTTQSALYLINISFFNLTYILGSIAFSVLCVIFLAKTWKSIDKR